MEEMNTDAEWGRSPFSGAAAAARILQRSVDELKSGIAGDHHLSRE